MAAPAPSMQVIRFGVYEADLRSAELRKHGIKIKLQDRPFRILCILLREPGSVVSRDQLRHELWPADTFVDFDHGISSAVNKLRDALSDSADNPRFIETLGRRGYRFIAPVGAPTSSPAVPSSNAAPVLDTPEAEAPTQPSPGVRNRKRWVLISLAGAIALAVGLTGWLLQPRQATVRQVTQLTTSGRVEHWGGIYTDGARLYFNERRGNRWPLMQTSTSGGEAVTAPAPFPNTKIFSISPNHSEMLVAGFTDMSNDLPLWIMPVQGGALRRVGDIQVDDAEWYPDGKRILFAHDHEVLSINRDGNDLRHLFRTAGNAYSFSWRPDGSSVRFTVAESPAGGAVETLWEASAEGTNLHQVLPGWQDPRSACCGFWMPDGRNYVFTAVHGTQRDIWMLREGGGLMPWNKRQPVRLTSGPNEFAMPVPSPDGKRLYVFGSQPKSTLYRLDQKKDFVPFLSGVAAIDLAFSRNGEWVAYISWPDLSLWRSRSDGTERLQLTASGPMKALRPRWSRDGTRILFVARQPGKGLAAYLIPAAGGSAVPVLPLDGKDRVFAEWSPDEQSILLDVLNQPQEPIVSLNLKTGKMSALPGSTGIICPRWSPDGAYIAARSSDETKLWLFDVKAQRWTHITTGGGIVRYEWGQTGRYLYFQDVLNPAQSVFRFDAATGKIDLAFDFSKPLQAGAMRCGFEGLAPDGSFLGSIRTGWADLYALDVELQ